MQSDENFIMKQVRRFSSQEANMQILISNPATVLTIYRCIDQYSQEIIAKTARLAYHTQIKSDKKAQIIKEMQIKNIAYYVCEFLSKKLVVDERPIKEGNIPNEFCESRCDLAQFNLINFDLKPPNIDPFLKSYIEIMNFGLTPTIEVYSNEHISMDKKVVESLWKRFCQKLLFLAQSSNNKEIVKTSDKILNDIIFPQKKDQSNQPFGNYLKFILEDTNIQIHKILVKYCQYGEGLSPKLVNFIVTLSNLDISKMYRCQYNNTEMNRGFDEQEWSILNDLVDFNLVSIKSNADTTFCITPLFWQFCYRKLNLNILNAKIIVETNFNVYAYINKSDIQIKDILDQFCDVHYMQSIEKGFPHMIVGQISEEKTKNSFKNGLTTELLMKFFNSSSDPKMKKHLMDKQMNAILLTQAQNSQKQKLDFLSLFSKKADTFSLIPDNVRQEIKAWEQEKDFQNEKIDINSDDEEEKPKKK